MAFAPAMKRAVLLPIALICLGFSASPTRGDTIVYDVVNLGTGSAIKVNGSRQVLMQVGPNVVRWEADVQTLIATNATAADMNAMGNVLASGKLYTDYGTFNIEDGQALNDLDQVAGYSNACQSFFLWDSGVTTNVAPSLDHLGVYVTSLNNAGNFAAITDTASPLSVFVIDGQVYPLHGGLDAYHGFLNDLDQGVFNSWAPVGLLQFAYSWENGVKTPLLPLHPEEYVWPYEEQLVANVNAINNQGQVVGRHGIIGPFDQYYIDLGGLLYQNGKAFRIDDLLSDQDATRWIIGEAYDINDQGDIIATAISKEDGRRYSVLLEARIVPSSIVPEPSSMALAAIGLAGAAGLARRKRV